MEFNYNLGKYIYHYKINGPEGWSTVRFGLLDHLAEDMVGFVTTYDERQSAANLATMQATAVRVKKLLRDGRYLDEDADEEYILLGYRVIRRPSISVRGAEIKFSELTFRVRETKRTLELNDRELFDYFYGFKHWSADWEKEYLRYLTPAALAKLIIERRSYGITILYDGKEITEPMV